MVRTMNVNSLLDECKQASGVATDSELAKRLGISKQAMSSYRKGVRLPDPVVAATIAGLSGVPLAKVLGIIGEARAVSREEKAVWRKLAATAAVTLCAIGLSIGGNAKAAQGKAFEDMAQDGHVSNAYYVKQPYGPPHATLIGKNCTPAKNVTKVTSSRLPAAAWACLRVMPPSYCACHWGRFTTGKPALSGCPTPRSNSCA